MKTLLPTIAMTFASISIASFPAKAAVLQYSGNFSVTYDTLSSSYQGVPQISGTWSFTFDDVAVPATGTYDTPTPIAISAINMTPSQIGTTTIDITNTSAFLRFSNKAVTQLLIGGNPSGPNGLSSGAADISV